MSNIVNPLIQQLVAQASQPAVTVNPSMTYSIRTLSDMGKSQAQLAAEFTQELNFVYGSFLKSGSNLTGNDDSTYRIWLGQIRRYYTHEQIMSGNYQMPEGKVFTFKETLGPVFHFVAGVIAYVPGFGTAAAFVINAAVSLGEGEPISQAVLDAVKGALPGQPVSTMAFDAAVAVANGETVDMIAIEALPIDDSTKEYVKIAARTIRGLAEGQAVSTVALQEIYYQLPSSGQHAMDLAQRVANGDKVGDIAMEEGAAYLQGASQQAINEYLANVGYQQLLNQVPETVQAGLAAGYAIAYGAKAQQGAPVATMQLGRAETDADRIRNDALAARGKQIAANNTELTYRRSLKRFLPQVVTTDDWRRGFDIGTASAVGLAGDTPTLQAIQKSIGTIAGKNGFAVGRDTQFHIASRSALFNQTKADNSVVVKYAVDLININAGAAAYGVKENPMAEPGALQLGRAVSMADRAYFRDLAAKGRAIAAADARLTSARLTGGRPIVAPIPMQSVTQTAATSQAKHAAMISAAFGADSLGPSSSEYRWGFDVGLGLCTGKSSTGPAMDSVRTKLGPFGVGINGDGIGTNEAIRGFDVAQAAAFGITRTGGAATSKNPSVGMGQLVGAGLAGATDAHAASVAGSIVSNAGAAQGLQQSKGLWTRFLEFFGLA